MSPSGPPGEHPTERMRLRRILEDMETLGAGEIFLDGMTRSEALGRVRPRSPARTTATPAPSEPGAPGPAGTRGAAVTAGGTSARPRELPVVPEGYDQLRREALACTACRLAEGRTQVVFSDGNPGGRLMVVGEAPGQREDETGLPFVGPAGQLLDLLLATVGLSRNESVYICNVLKCRPPGNRNPLPDEIELCSPYLRRQVELVRPEVILAVGTFSAQLLTGRPVALGKLRGSVYSYAGTPLVVTYHPAALLRNQSWTRATWDDLQLLRQVMDGHAGAGELTLNT